MLGTGNTCQLTTNKFKGKTQTTIHRGRAMTFEKMTVEQLRIELNRYRDQLFNQKMPITEAQKRRFYALRNAYNRASADEYR